MVEEIEEIMDESEYTLRSDHMTIQEISAEILRLWAINPDAMIRDPDDGRLKPTVFLSVMNLKGTVKESKFIVGLFEIGEGDLSNVTIDYTTEKVKYRPGMFFATFLSLKSDCELNEVPDKIIENLNKSLSEYEEVTKKNEYQNVIFEKVKTSNRYTKMINQRRSINMRLIRSLKEK